MHCVDMWVHDSFQIETMFVSETKDHIHLSGEDGDRGLFKLRFTIFFINSATEVMYVNLGVQVSCSNCEISIQRHKYDIFASSFFF